jgi:hypothetical protein
VVDLKGLTPGAVFVALKGDRLWHKSGGVWQLAAAYATATLTVT